MLLSRSAQEQTQEVEVAQGSFAEPEEEHWLPEGRAAPCKDRLSQVMRSALAIDRQDLSCCKFSLALSDPADTNAVLLPAIKPLLASQPFLKGRGGPGPRGSCV